MGVFSSGLDKHHVLKDQGAYRWYLVSRNQAPIVVHSGEMQLKRLRVLARKLGKRVRAALVIIHKAIMAAKLRQVQRELMFHTGSHDEWSRSGPGWRERDGLGKDIRNFPQRPLILSDKWDS